MIRPARFSARTVVAGLVTVSVLSAGAAIAIDRTSSGPPSIDSIRAASGIPGADPSPSPSPSPHKRGPHGAFPGVGPGFGVGGLGFGVGAGELLRIVTKDTGLTVQQVVQDIKNGQTLDQIAGSHSDQVKADALAAVKKALDGAVGRNVITSGQETSLLNDARDVIAQLMAAKLGNAGFGDLPKGVPFGGPRPHASPKPAPSSSSSSNATATT